MRSGIYERKRNSIRWLSFHFFPFLFLGLLRLGMHKMCTRNVGGAMSLGRIYKTHLRPSCTQSGCAIKSSVYSLVSTCRDRGIFFFFITVRWRHTHTHSLTHRTPGAQTPNRKIWYRKKRRKIFIRSRLRFRSWIFTLLRHRMSAKKAIAPNDSAGNRKKKKNASEREKIMTKAKQKEQKKKKNNAKTIENAMKHHRMNIVPTTNILYANKKEQKRKKNETRK